MKKSIVLAVLVACTAQAGTILQEQELAVSPFGPPFLSFIGQTFLAEDPVLSSIGVRLAIINLNPEQTDPTVHLSLYAGNGTGGPLIAQRSITPTLSLEPYERIWLDFDVTGVPVTPGETYTLTISEPSYYWGAVYNRWFSEQNPDIWEGRIDYPGGALLTQAGFYQYEDLTFRVVPIPEPSTILLLLVGLGFCVFRFLKSSRL